MVINNHTHRCFQNSFFAPARGIFEDKATEPVSKNTEEMAETVKNPTVHEEEPALITLRSTKIEEAVKPEKTKGARIQVASGIRRAVKETLDEKMTRLERENTALLEENKKLKKLGKLAINDNLTGLYTRNYFDDHIVETTDEAIRYGKDFSLLFIDLDKFKALNDTMGHQAGDEALRLVGKIINETCRPSDVKCRYGGEELIIILPETDRYKALVLAERLRKSIKARMIPHLREMYGENADKQTGTVSIGISSYNDSANRNEKDEEKLARIIIKEADDALYAAKESGRDTVRIYGEKITEEGNKDNVDLTGQLDEYATQVRKNAEEIIPEANMREAALREAANQIRKDLRIKSIKATH